MKTLIAVLMVAVNGWACDAGFEDREGVCANVGQLAADQVKPSEEKAAHSRRPSYEDPAIHADMPPSCLQTRETHPCIDDQAIIAANQGKEAAGVPQ